MAMNELINNYIDGRSLRPPRTRSRADRSDIGQAGRSLSGYAPR
jgi:hypothetical protein